MDTNRKQWAAGKLNKLLALYHNNATSPGEKIATGERIKEICEKYNLKIEGFIIKDLDKPIQKTPQELREGRNPWANYYVIYKGKKYYGGVPKSVLKK